MPRDWAMTENNLGTVLEDQGRRREDEGGDRLLAQAVDAYRSALQVYTRDEFPQAWSMAEDNLGNVLNEIVRRQHPQAASTPTETTAASAPAAVDQ